VRLLVTGGAGFIGSHFIRHILSRYPTYDVVNLDNLTYAGNLENLVEIERDARYRFVQGDICDPSVVNPLARGVDAIVNFAAETHVDRSILDSRNFIRTDALGTHVLLEACRQFGHRCYVQISTDEVYGSIDTGLFSEDDRLRPSSPYSASKAAGDLLTLAYFTTYELPVIVTRSSNNFGPNQYPEKLIPLFITNAIEGKPLPVYGDGLNVRDWLYVIDHCCAIDLVLHRGQPGSIYNIGGGNERTNLEITHLILQELHQPETLIGYVEDRAGHDRRYGLDCRRITALGFRPAFRFEDALRATVRWYKEHPAWWRRIKAGAFRRYYQQQYQSRSKTQN
jgi:dTDP-glucose 4,6-dehydratase